MADMIWSCPDCQADLTDGYCPDCQYTWPWAALALDPPEAPDGV